MSWASDQAGHDEAFAAAALSMGVIDGPVLDEARREQASLLERGQSLTLGQVLLRRGRIDARAFVAVQRRINAYPEGESTSPAAAAERPIDRANLARRALTDGEAEHGSGPDSFLGGRYIRRETLGRGGMAEVFRATDRLLRRDVAVKVLKPTIEIDESMRRRFERECRVLAGLRHPNIVRLLDAGEDDGRLFLTMDLVEGGDLGALLAGAAYETDDLLARLADVADAIDHAHDQDIVHRDLKPGNILVGAGNELLVTDFGLAQLAGSSLALTPVDGGAIGTPLYMAPEQIDAGEVSPRTDVHALGLILYQVLTGRTPYRGRNIREVFGAILAGDAIPIRKIAPTVPRQLEAVVARAMASRPEDRYPTAGDLASDLRAHLAGEATTARPPGPLARLAMSARRRPARFATLSAILIGTLLLVAGVTRRSFEIRRLTRQANQAETAGDWMTVVDIATRLEGLGDPDAAYRRTLAIEALARVENDRKFEALLAEIEQAELEIQKIGRLHLVTVELFDRMAFGELDLAEMSAVESTLTQLENGFEANELRLHGLFLSALRLRPDDRALARRFLDSERERLARLLEAGQPSSAGVLASVRRIEEEWGLESTLERVVIDSDPPGAEVHLLRYRFHPKSKHRSPTPFGDDSTAGLLGRCPIEIDLPLGSYLFVLTGSDRNPTRLPIQVLPTRPIEEVVRLDPLPGTEELTYVAGGPTLVGGSEFAIPLRRRRQVRVEGFHIATDEVACVAYQRFLNDREFQSVDEARRRLPRYGRTPRSNIFRERDGLFDISSQVRDLPIAGVSWHDAQAFCRWMSGQAPSGTRYQLPSRLQYERAARGADGRLYPWGDTFDWSASITSLSPRARPVGTRPVDVSPFGVRDLSGNVAEWLLDEGSVKFENLVAESHAIHSAAFACPIDTWRFQASAFIVASSDTTGPHLGFRYVLVADE